LDIQFAKIFSAKISSRENFFPKVDFGNMRGN